MTSVATPFSLSATATTPAKTATSKQDSLPWVEKYRPRTMDDVVAQEEVVTTLRSAMSTSGLPHLLFYGSPGTGKTSTILALAHELFGDEFRERVLELNASDERGIGVIRSKVKTFAQTFSTERIVGGKLIPAYKIIVLDEADSMTVDAQNALRRTMEIYAKGTRFCLICNYVSRITDPLASRCAKFRFKPLGTDSTVTRLETICAKEGVKYGTDVLLAIHEVSNGDLRKAINFLQSLASSCGSDITPNIVRQIAGVIPQSVLLDFVQACKSFSYTELRQAVTALQSAGYPADQFLVQLMAYLVEETTLTQLQKAAIAECLSQADHALLDGGSPALQLLFVGSQIGQVISSQQDTAPPKTAQPDQSMYSDIDPDDVP
ncbi:Replication factor C subunit 2 [Pelomyxa schiedti]|nr:Replication factor C subunit 2 [Pelomyxa schiedti]